MEYPKGISPFLKIFEEYFLFSSPVSARIPKEFSCVRNRPGRKGLTSCGKTRHSGMASAASGLRSYSTIRRIAMNDTYANVPGNKVATYKQLKALGFRFAKLHSPDNTYGMSKVFTAILVKYQNENPKTPITHTDVQNFFEIQEVPAKFVKQIKIRGQQASKSSKKTVKVTKVEPKAPKASKKPIAQTPKESKAPAASSQSVEDFKNSLNSLKNRVSEVEKRQATLETKFDLLWAFVQEELGK